jgi:Peptidase family M23
MSELILADGTALRRLVAKRVTSSATRLIGTQAVSEAELADRLAEIELQTQTGGASFLKLHLDDPDLSLTTSGWLARNKEGLLEAVELEFPEKSGWQWVLCAAECSTELSGPNLVVTFEDKIVADLREHWGPKPAPPGTQTRAQFVHDLFVEAKVPLVCKSLNVIQPVESEEKNELGTAVVKTGSEQQRAHEQENKTRGVGHGADITIGGAKPTSTQLDTINTLLHVANELDAGQLATEALIYAAIGETKIGGELTTSSAGAQGVLQSLHAPYDTSSQARNFLLGNEDFHAGGAIKRSREVTDPRQIAVEVEVPSVWPANAYAHEAGGGNFLAEAKAIIQAGGGLKLGGSSTSTAAESDVMQLTRGTAENPDEDSWECSTRLAQQVNWFMFTDGKKAFYESGPDLARQKPSLYFDVPANHVVYGHSGESQSGVITSPSTVVIDNTSFLYRKTHKVKTRSQRRSKAVKPSSPAEVKLNIVCDIAAFRAGQVFVGQHSGLWDDRWICVDATRKCLKDPFTELTLEPPVEPLPEPKATEKGEELAGLTGTKNLSGYTNPFGQIKNLTPLRVDMGVDYGGQGPIVAMADATVFFVGGAGWPGGGFVGLTLNSGPFAGKQIYHAENITVEVKQGQNVKAGQRIATMHSAEPHTESGWASGSGEGTLAASLGQQAKTGDAGSVTTAAGASFNKLLIELGCPSGKTQGAISGTMPTGYP